MSRKRIHRSFKFKAIVSVEFSRFDSLKKSRVIGSLAASAGMKANNQQRQSVLNTHPSSARKRSFPPEEACSRASATLALNVNGIFPSCTTGQGSEPSSFNFRPAVPNMARDHSNCRESTGASGSPVALYPMDAMDALLGRDKPNAKSLNSDLKEDKENRENVSAGSAKPSTNRSRLIKLWTLFD